jgi:hypothetical protein
MGSISGSASLLAGRVVPLIHVPVHAVAGSDILLLRETPFIASLLTARKSGPA